MDCVWRTGARRSSRPWARPTRPAARADKKGGGVLLDVASGEVVTRGLSMPHSPRWYDGRLGVLDSGSGGFGHIDPVTGKYEALAVLPGFTRGLDFCGPLAFIGLSQVRESAVFSGIAIAERPLEERCCGVWVVNIHTGRTIAFVKFEDAPGDLRRPGATGCATARRGQRPSACDRRFVCRAG